jgi:putative transcription factor
MANCEICGREEELYDTTIEGTILNVCSKCSKFGKVNKKVSAEVPVFNNQNKVFHSTMMPVQQNEKVELINSNYADLIKKKREQLGLKQIELAKKIAEKESLIHKIESGHAEPNLAVAIKLERCLGIKLVKEEEIKKINLKSNSGKLTIGDIIDIK